MAFRLWCTTGIHSFEFADECTVARIKADNATKASLGDFIPIPPGASLWKDKDRLVTAVSETPSIRFRRVYGYVGEITYLQEDKDIPITCKTPARIQAVIMLWWRYGCLPEERYDRWAYVRVVAFTSTAAFEDESAIWRLATPSPACLRRLVAHMTRRNFLAGSLFRLPSGIFAPRDPFLTPAWKLTAMMLLRYRLWRRTILATLTCQMYHLPRCMVFSSQNTSILM